MDLRRLRAGEWIAALSGAALLLSLFVPWHDEELSGWSSLAVLDVVLALIAAAALALLFITATQRVPALPVALDALLVSAGLVAVVLVVVRVLDLPEGAAGRGWGLWVALAGALGIAAGAILAARDERLSPPGRRTDATGRPTQPPDEIAPPPASHLEGSSR